MAKTKQKQVKPTTRSVQESLRPRKVERDVLEFFQSPKPCRVDREKGIIYDCKVVGFESKNGGFYPKKSLETASPLYEGAHCNLNHPDRDNPGKDRDVRDRFGIFHNFHVGDDGAYADLHYLKTHPLAATICEAAETEGMSRAFGFSHNARSIQIPDGKGGVIHESIVRVRSIDLVADPATTLSIFESEYQMNDPHTQGSDMLVEPEATLEADPIDAAIDALLAKSLPKIKAETDKSARKKLLDDMKKKIDAVISALTEEVDSGDGGSETKTETGETETETEESVKPKVEEPGKEVIESKTETTNYEHAIDVLESCHVQPTKIRIKALLAIPDSDREALANSWPKIGETETTIPKPRSSSVLESSKTETKPAAAPTADQLKDDAMRLMSSAR